MSTASDSVSLPSDAREFVGHGPDMPAISWPGGARVAVSLVVNYEEGSERTPLYGDPSAEGMGEGFAVPPATRDLRNESHFDYGSRVGHWRILEILNRHRVVQPRPHPADENAAAAAGLHLRLRRVLRRSALHDFAQRRAVDRGPIRVPHERHEVPPAAGLLVAG